MINIFNRKKKYIVSITDKKGTDYVETIANNKKEAKQIVSDVLLKCEIFRYKSINDFQLKCKKMKKSNV